MDGYITGVRFYKGAGNVGPHVGNLWTGAGTLLGSAAFAAETASGWQEVRFATAAPITGGAHVRGLVSRPDGPLLRGPPLFRDS